MIIIIIVIVLNYLYYGIHTGIRGIIAKESALAYQAESAFVIISNHTRSHFAQLLSEPIQNN